MDLLAHIVRFCKETLLGYSVDSDRRSRAFCVSRRQVAAAALVAGAQELKKGYASAQPSTNQ